MCKIRNFYFYLFLYHTILLLLLLLLYIIALHINSYIIILYWNIILKKREKIKGFKLKNNNIHVVIYTYNNKNRIY